MTYREATGVEKTLINRALDRWGVFEVFKEKMIIIEENGRSKKVLLVPRELKPLIMKMRPYKAGLGIGELKKQFMPSMPGADLFARIGKRNDFYITVNEIAEKLVLYGRDVMGESIVEASSKIGENELVIVLNSMLEAIAIGRTRFDGKYLFQRGKVTVTTLTDAGYYLREEG